MILQLLMGVFRITITVCLIYHLNTLNAHFCTYWVQHLFQHPYISYLLKYRNTYNYIYKYVQNDPVLFLCVVLIWRSNGPNYQPLIRGQKPSWTELILYIFKLQSFSSMLLLRLRLLLLCMLACDKLMLDSRFLTPRRPAHCSLQLHLCEEVRRLLHPSTGGHGSEPAGTRSSGVHRGHAGVGQ